MRQHPLKKQFRAPKNWYRSWNTMQKIVYVNIKTPIAKKVELEKKNTHWIISLFKGQKRLLTIKRKSKKSALNAAYKLMKKHQR